MEDSKIEDNDVKKEEDNIKDNYIGEEDGKDCGRKGGRGRYCGK